jgi:hypothetical protein
MRKLCAAIIMFGWAYYAHADGLIDDLDSYSTPLFDPVAGSYGFLNGQGGWVTADLPGESSDMWLVDGWGFPGVPGNKGNYWIPGGAQNGIARSIGALSEGDTISWIMSINGSPGVMDVAIGSNLANGNAGDDAKFHVEMGIGAGNRQYYNIHDSAGGSSGNQMHTNIDAGNAGHWAEVAMTMGAGLNSVDLRARNLTRHWDPDLGTTVLGPADWVDIGGVDFNTGGIAGTDLWISFTGQGGVNVNWSQSVVFDNVKVTPGLPILIDFESYNTGVDLVGQGGWVEADGFGGSGNGNTDMKVVAGAGMGGSNAFVVGSSVNEDAAFRVGEFFAGYYFTVDLKITTGSGLADVWIGERMADGTTAGPALVLQVDLGGGNLYKYSLREYPDLNFDNIVILGDDTAGKQGDWAQVRMSMIDMPGGCDFWGFNSAILEARNLTTGGDWQVLGAFPVNSDGIGDGTVDGHEISIVLGGSGVTFDNLNAVAAPFNLDCDLIQNTGNTILSDLFPDCYVDALDLARLGSDWLNCNDPADPVNCTVPGGNPNALDIDFDTNYVLGNLVGQNGWVVGEGNGTTTAATMNVTAAQGEGGTDGMVIGASSYEHAALNVGTLEIGAQASMMFRIDVNSDFAELWVGDARHVDGSNFNEVSLHVEVGRTTGDLYYYSLYTNSPASTSGGTFIDSDDSVGKLGDWAEVRMTLSKSGNPAFGIDGATVEARNVTTGSSWKSIGTLPTNTAGIGFDDIFLVLGGQGAHFDNVQIDSPGPADCAAVLAQGLGMSSDIVADCYINLPDFAAVAADWMRCNDPANVVCEGYVGETTGLDLGHEKLIEWGLQLGAEVVPAVIGYFDPVRWAESNLTTVDLVGTTYPVALMPPAPGVPFSTSGIDADQLRADGYGPYMSMCRSVTIGGGEEFQLYDPEYRHQIKTGFCSIRQDYPWVLVHTIQASRDSSAFGFSATQLKDYMADCKPDLLEAWSYPFNGVNPGGSPTTLYSGLEKYRVTALAGNDLTGNRPIPTGFYTQLFIDDFGNGFYSLSESEIRLNNFALWTFGFKKLIHFIYHWRGAHLPAVIFDGADTESPNAKFDQIAETSRQSLNLGPALVRLISTDLRMVRGRHNPGAVANDLPSYEVTTSGVSVNMSTWSAGADPYITGLTVTNLSGKNDGLDGDVFVGYFKPLADEFTNAGHENDIYFMVLNGLSDSASTPAQTQQQIRLDFDFGGSGITSLQRLSRDTGLVETVNLVSDGGSLYHLDLLLEGGTGDLFKFNNGGTFVGP